MNASIETIPYWGYAVGEAMQNAVEQVATPGSSVLNYTGLSPFDIPHSVFVEAHSGDVCIFRFQYPNDEPAEGVRRPISRDESIRADLGLNSRKVLAVHMSGATEKLRHNEFNIDVDCAAAWTAGLPQHAWNTSRRNLSVVRGIIQSLPGEFRNELLRALQHVNRY